MPKPATTFSKTAYSGFFPSRSSISQTPSHNPLNTHRPSATTPPSPSTCRRCGDNVIADINTTTNDVVRIYVTPMLDANVSMTDHTGATAVSYYYNADERQSVMNLTDGTGAVVASYGYSAYGDPIDTFTHSNLPTFAQRYTFTGRESSDVSGDYYFRYRWYGPASGSFFSRDPLGYVDGLSMYAGYFAILGGVDATGLCNCDCKDDEVGDIGGEGRIVGVIK